MALWSASMLRSGRRRSSLRCGFGSDAGCLYRVFPFWPVVRVLGHPSHTRRAAKSDNALISWHCGDPGRTGGSVSPQLPGRCSGKIVGMPIEPTKSDRVFHRELAWFQTNVFMGWGCNGCGWLHQIPRRPASEKALSQEAKEAFARHKCESFRRS